MPELLVELFSEEIPARFQRRAAEDLKQTVTSRMVDAGLTYESAGSFATPRRLALHIDGIPPQSPATREERKGPRVGSADQAIEGFLRGAGLSSIDEAQIENDPKKGDFYVAVIEKAGAPAIELLAAILMETVEGFSWAKSMRWGSGRLNWVRPLRAITATFGTENDEPEVISFEFDGLGSGQTTFGHRFLAPDAIRVRRFDDYVQSLERARVVLDTDRRKQIIKTDAEQIAFAQGLSVIEDDGLLEEVAGLVEWPNVMLGGFDAAYLDLPEEVIIATIRKNQKCFCLRDSASGKLANKFVIISNMLPTDDGGTIVSGNERVIRARLSDAKFFYANDLGRRLEDRLDRLQSSVFHAKLGSQRERLDRLVALAKSLAPKVGADETLAARAALLAKADLVSEMVVEFPDLQGIMGRYYALAQDEPAQIAEAISTHYSPLGPTDAVPTEPVSIAVALADKLDLLTGFWSIDEKPTGSRDPYALRRAALGVIRILVENEISLDLPKSVKGHDWIMDSVDTVEAGGEAVTAGGERVSTRTPSLLSFFHDRLKVMLRDKGARHDLVDAVISPDSGDMLDISRRVEALSGLLEAEAGQSLLAGYRRGANILAAEEKKDGTAYSGAIDQALLSGTEEKALAAAIEAAEPEVSAKAAAADYAGAVAALALLRAPVDAFFEAVMVNDQDAAIRANRLKLLSGLRDVMHRVADFSKISG